MQFRVTDEHWAHRRGRMLKISGEKRRRSRRERMIRREMEYLEVMGVAFKGDMVILVCLTLLRGVALVFDSPTTLLLSGNKIN